MIKPANPWVKCSSKHVYTNPWIRVREDTVITPTGSNGIYGLVESDDSVMITAINDKNEVCMVHTFSYPAQSWHWELPGGGGDGQDLLTASKRELEEETGIQANIWEKLGRTRVCNGLMTEKMDVYLARDISFTGKKENADEQIDIIRFFSLSEIDAMIERDEVNDGQSITGIYFVTRWIQKYSEVMTKNTSTPFI